MLGMIPVKDMIEQDEPMSENQQIAIDYARDHVLPMLTANGVWVAPGPYSPLSMMEAAFVLKAISELDEYDGQKIDLLDSDGGRVRLTNGGTIIEFELVPNG